MAFESAQRNFLQRTTRGFYKHAPLLNYNERAQFDELLRPKKQERKVVVVATQIQMQDKYRKRGWKLMDNLVHALSPGFAKVYVNDGMVAVIYPDATVSRHQRIQVEYQRGWFSPSEKEKQEVRRLSVEMDIPFAKLFTSIVKGFVL